MLDATGGSTPPLFERAAWRVWPVLKAGRPQIASARVGHPVREHADDKESDDPPHHVTRLDSGAERGHRRRWRHAREQAPSTHGSNASTQAENVAMITIRSHALALGS